MQSWLKQEISENNEVTLKFVYIFTVHNISE